MQTTPRVYVLDNVSEEAIAHAFAKTSRSAESFSQMVQELTDTKTAAFHEKWVLKFGHSSVAEHAVLHLALEGASRLAIEAIEKCRLASYTEQSTRYQPISSDRVYRSDDWPSDFSRDYEQCMSLLFELYSVLAEKSKEQSSLKSPYDVARFALPLSTLANVGMTINTRSLRRTLCTMLASEHEEIVQLAHALQTAAADKTPTLLKYVAPCRSREILAKYKAEVDSRPSLTSIQPFSVRVAESSVDIRRIAKHLLYEEAGEEIESFAVAPSLLDGVLQEQEWHDATYRALEYGDIEFEIVSDYGTYYDIKRHRMATIQRQKSIGHLGYIMPFASVLKETGADQLYIETMNNVFELFFKWGAKHPDAIYMLPNAARCRYSMRMNPRESHAVIKLRGLHADGHSSYRTVGLKIFELCKDRWPELYSWLDKFNEKKTVARELEKDYLLIRPK